MKKMHAVALAIVSVAVSSCAMTSGVMPNSDGTYTVSATAAPVRGGATGANAAAFQEAQKFCADQGSRAQLLTGEDRDVYQSAIGGGWNRQGGGFSGGTFAAGNAKIVFRCVH